MLKLISEKSPIVIPVKIPPEITIKAEITTRSPLYFKKSILLWRSFKLSPTNVDPKTAHRNSGKCMHDKIKVSLRLLSGNRLIKITAHRVTTDAITILPLDKLFFHPKKIVSNGKTMNPMFL